MAKVYYINNYRKSKKTSERKKKLRRMAHTVGDWLYNNKELVSLLTPVIFGAVTTTVKVIFGAVTTTVTVVGRHKNLQKEEQIKNRYCYDRSLGHYWALKRGLSNREWIEIDKRKQNGERLADILSEMKVLK